MHILYDLREMSIRCMESLGLAGWSYGGKFYELKVHLNIFCIVFDVVNLQLLCLQFDSFVQVSDVAHGPLVLNMNFMLMENVPL